MFITNLGAHVQQGRAKKKRKLVITGKITEFRGQFFFSGAMCFCKRFSERASFFSPAPFSQTRFFFPAPNRLPPKHLEFFFPAPFGPSGPEKRKIGTLRARIFLFWALRAQISCFRNLRVVFFTSWTLGCLSRVCAPSRPVFFSGAFLTGQFFFPAPRIHVKM